MKLHLLFACALLLAACDDPSNVGLGLVGDESGIPVIVRADLQQTTQIRPDPTGNASQALAGVTDDPLLGTITAAAFFDFGSPQVLNGNSAIDTYRASNVQSVTLTLPISYRYGDTLSTVTYALRRIPEPFVATNAPSDTSLAVGEIITTFQVAANAQTASVEMPADWVAELDPTLRSVDFLNAFNGLYLEAQTGNAVLGFRQSGAPDNVVAFTARSSADTIRYVANSGITTLARQGQPALGAGATLLQDGFGRQVTLDLSPNALEAFRGSALARVVVEFPTLAVLGDQGSYVRPQSESLRLIAVDRDGTDVVVGGAALVDIMADAGSDGVLRFSSTRLQQFVQSALLDDPFCFDAEDTDCFGPLVLRFAPFDNTINAVVLSGTPQAALTLIPTTD
jgi:hypothetical protein